MHPFNAITTLLEMYFSDTDTSDEEQFINTGLAARSIREDSWINEPETEAEGYYDLSHVQAAEEAAKVTGEVPVFVEIIGMCNTLYWNDFGAWLEGRQNFLSLSPWEQDMITESGYGGLQDFIGAPSKTSSTLARGGGPVGAYPYPDGSLRPLPEEQSKGLSSSWLRLTTQPNVRKTEFSLLDLLEED